MWSRSAGVSRVAPIARAIACPEGRLQVSWRSRLCRGRTACAVWVCGPIAGSGKREHHRGDGGDDFLVVLGLPVAEVEEAGVARS